MFCSHPPKLAIHLAFGVGPYFVDNFAYMLNVYWRMTSIFAFAIMLLPPFVKSKVELTSSNKKRGVIL